MRKGERGPRVNAGPVEIGEVVMLIDSDGWPFPAAVVEVFKHGFRAHGHVMIRYFEDYKKTWKKGNDQ